MAILNLIGSSGEISRGRCKLKVPGGLRLSSTFRSKELNDVIQTFCPDGGIWAAREGEHRFNEYSG
jgi:hypothetical protein